MINQTQPQWKKAPKKEAAESSGAIARERIDYPRLSQYVPKNDEGG